MNYYNEIKNKLVDNEIYKRVKDYSKNKNELMTYYEVGKLLIEAQGGEERAKYGDGLIKEYSKRLTLELGKGYTFSALTRMRKFYLISKKVATVSQLSWSHYIELLKLYNIDEIKYYINLAINYNLSVRDLRYKIKSNEYERLDDNAKNNLLLNNNLNIEDNLKHPIIIKNRYNNADISEKMLKQLILDDIGNFMTELGDGFSFINSEYKIKLGDRYNYIDLLLFNYKYNCFVVIELKITELKAEHIGQIKKYINYIDKDIKDITHNKTIGIIIVRKDNKFVMEYCSDPSIFRTIYMLVGN